MEKYKEKIVFFAQCFGDHEETCSQELIQLIISIIYLVQ